MSVPSLTVRRLGWTPEGPFLRFRFEVRRGERRLEALVLAARDGRILDVQAELDDRTFRAGTTGHPDVDRELAEHVAAFAARKTPPRTIGGRR